MNAPAADPILTVEHLSIRFGGLVAVDDLSFAAARGHITAPAVIAETAPTMASHTSSPAWRWSGCNR